MVHRFCPILGKSREFEDETMGDELLDRVESRRFSLDGILHAGSRDQRQISKGNSLLTSWPSARAKKHLSILAVF